MIRFFKNCIMLVFMMLSTLATFAQEKEVDMAEYVNKAWNADGNNIGEGWQLWAQWMGRFIDPIDNLILLDHIKK